MLREGSLGASAFGDCILRIRVGFSLRRKHALERPVVWMAWRLFVKNSRRGSSRVARADLVVRRSDDPDYPSRDFSGVSAAVNG
jgi:hypothetical protein